MNIIRTKAVELSVIPAIAYKLKLKSGGAGIKILRLDNEHSAVATIDKRTGEAVPYSKYLEEFFPDEAFEEAIDLTIGMPYSARGNITVKPEPTEDDYSLVSKEPTETTVNIVETKEYTAIVERYSDEKGKINYTLMNKDFIQFASKSKIVSSMIEENSQVEDVITYVLKNRAAYIAGEKEPVDDNTAKLLLEALDEIDPRSAFKELKAHINRKLAKSKRG